MSSAPPPSTDPLSGDPAADSSAPTLTREDVAHLAHLARLQLTEQELDIYVGQLSVILDAVTTVSAVAAADADIEPVVLNRGCTGQGSLMAQPWADDVLAVFTK